MIVHDPFRELEGDGPEVREWLQRQQQRTTEVLARIPTRPELASRIAELGRAPKTSLPLRRGGKRFWRARQGEELALLYVDDGSGARVLLDPNQFDRDRNVTLLDVHPSPDGELVAYRLSRDGSSSAALHVLRVATGELLPDHVPAELNPVAHAWHTRNCVAWTSDGRGFYYTRRPTAVRSSESRYHQKLWFHRLGDHWSEDALVFGATLSPEQVPYPRLADDGTTLLVVVQDLSGSRPSSQLYLRAHPSTTFERSLAGCEGFADAIVDGDTLFVRTDHEAPLGKLVAVPIAAPGARPSTLIPEGDGPLRRWLVHGEFLVIETLVQAASQLCVHRRTGDRLGPLPLPGIGSVAGLEPDGDRILFSFSSPLASRSIHACNLRAQTCERIEAPAHELDRDRFEVRRVSVRADDGMTIPMFLTHARDLPLTGDHPTVLYGYGGFGVSVRPSFRPEVVPFLERGGVFASACVRGGGEFGEAWHRAGMRDRKQVVFDDFIAAATWLIDAGYTQPARLGCLGGSNGGLLVTAAVTQRPELWRAVVARAPVTDMARFHHAPGGRHWIAEYGDPENPDDLEIMLRYSPYHAPAPTHDAPAAMIVCGRNDDRVPAWHAYKLDAVWQAASTSGHPVLLWTERDAGHHGARALSKMVERHADTWGFLLWQLTQSGAQSIDRSADSACPGRGSRGTRD
jgi:prolyl oligopeptidase